MSRGESIAVREGLGGQQSLVLANLLSDLWSWSYVLFLQGIASVSVYISL